MLNERDGGIGGVKLGDRGMRDRLRHQEGRRVLRAPSRARSPVVINPYSTGITLQLIPKAAVDKIPVLSMAYGLSASADGNVFPWIFNPPATYWDGASAIRQARGRRRRRLRQAQGQEDRSRPSRCALWQGADPAARGARAELRLHAQALSRSPAAEMQNQSSHLAQRPARPARLALSAGLGRDEPDRGQGSRQDRLPDGPPRRRLVVGRR